MFVRPIFMSSLFYPQFFVRPIWFKQKIFYSRQNKDTKNRYVLIHKLQLIGDEPHLFVRRQTHFVMSHLFVRPISSCPTCSLDPFHVVPLVRQTHFIMSHLFVRPILCCPTYSLNHFMLSHLFIRPISSCFTCSLDPFHPAPLVCQTHFIMSHLFVGPISSCPIC